MEQFELFSTNMPDEETVVPAEKRAYFQEALPLLQKIAATRNISPEQLDFFTRSQYSTVYFKSFLAFRIKMRGGKQYISFPATIKKSIKTDWPMEQTASEKTFYRIVLANSSLLPMMNVLEQILLATIDRYQAEWDCCSRYMESRTIGFSASYIHHF